MQISRCVLLLAVTLSASTGARAAVRGRVLSPDGQPVPSAEIVAFTPEASTERAERVASGRKRVPVASAPSGPDGSFLLPTRLPVVDLTVRAGGFAPGFGTVADGDRTVLVVKRARTVRGQVLAGGQPVDGATVVWAQEDSAMSAPGAVVTQTGSDGTYEVPDPKVWAGSFLVNHHEYAPLSGPLDRSSAVLRHELVPGVTVAGRVLERQTGRPVADARLEVDGWPAGHSASDGAFLLGHIAPDWTRIVATRHDLAGSASPQAGETIVQVTPAHGLHGVVVDADSGAPVAGAFVWISGGQRGGTWWTTTDTLGRYAFSGLLADQYGAMAGHPTHDAAMTMDPWRFASIDLRRAATVERDFRLSPRRLLRGRVADERGRPVDRAFVRLGPRAQPISYSRGERLDGSRAWTGAGGDFELPLPDASEPELALTVLKPGYAAGRIDLTTLDEAPGPHVVVTLARGLELRGRVTTLDGAPAPDVAVSVVESSAFVGAHSFLAVAAAEDGWTSTDADGRFSVRVRPAVHEVALRRTGLAPKSVRALDPATPLEVVLEPAAEIRGRVVRSSGVAVAGVTLLATGKEAVMPRGNVTTSTSDGSFALTDLSPGPYTLHYINRQAILNGMLQVEAPASDLRIDIGPRGALSGYVFDAATGEPLERFEVTAGADPSDVRDGSRLVFDIPVEGAAGAFLIEELPAGEVTLTARASGYLVRRVEGLTVVGDQTTQTEVPMERGASIRGQVTTEESLPLPGTQVTAAGEDGESVRAESDDAGEYRLEGVLPGTVKLEFALEGFRSQSRTLEVVGAGRLDVTLPSGLSVRGQVLAGGAGVGGAVVSASSSALDAASGHTVSDEQGRFTLSGLSPGRYSISVSTSHGESSEIEDVDVATAGFIRVELERRETAQLSGWITGLDHADEVGTVMVSATAEGGRSEVASVDANGAFRMATAPVGQVTVQATAMTAGGASRSSRANVLALSAGAEEETVLEFATGFAVSGEVWRDGAPLPAATVWFHQPRPDRTVARAHTDDQGWFEVSGLESGPHVIEVRGSGASFEMDYVVNGDDQLMIDVSGATLRGTVVDAESGAPLPEADVSLWRLGAGERRPEASLESDSAGAVARTSLKEGRYRLLASKRGFGQRLIEIGLARGETTEVLVELPPAEGLTLAVVDGRDGRSLDATVIVRDTARRIVANQHARVEGGDLFVVPVSAGPYLLSTSADGYGTVTRPVTAPGSGLRIELTPGGTLVVESARALHGNIRLVGPDGEEYVRCWCNGLAEIELTGRRTTIEHVTPAVYSIELVDELGRVARTGLNATIREGQVSRVILE